MSKTILTRKRLKEMLHYDPETGDFTWMTSTNNFIKMGDVAGCLNKIDGYIRIMVDGKLYLGHRLAFLYMTGKFPIDQCDHDNQIRSDNRWENLNQATDTTNSKNRSMRNDNTSGCVGVSWHKRDNKWHAKIGVNRKYKHLGIFAKKSDAIKARKAADIEYGFHKNHGSEVR